MKFPEILLIKGRILALPSFCSSLMPGTIGLPEGRCGAAAVRSNSWSQGLKTGRNWFIEVAESKLGREPESEHREARKSWGRV